MIAAFRYELRRLGSLRATRRVPVVAAVVAGALGGGGALGGWGGGGGGVVAVFRLAGALAGVGAGVLVGAAALGHGRGYAMRFVPLAVVPGGAWVTLAKTTFTALLSALTGALVALAAALGYTL